MAKLKLKRMSDNMPTAVAVDGDARRHWDEVAAGFDKELERVEKNVDRYFGARFQRDYAFENMEAAMSRMEAIALEHPSVTGFVMDAYAKLGACVEPWAHDKDGDLDFDVATFAVENGSVFARSVLTDTIDGYYHEPMFYDPSAEIGASRVFEGWHERVGRAFQERAFDDDGELATGRSIVAGIDFDTIDKAVDVMVAGRDEDVYGADVAHGYLSMLRHRGDALTLDHLMKKSVESGLVAEGSREMDILRRDWKRVMLDAATATVEGRMTPDESLRSVALELAGIEYVDASDSLRVDRSVAPEWLQSSLAEDPPAAMRGDGSVDMKVEFVGSWVDNAPLRPISKPPVMSVEEADEFSPGMEEAFGEAMRIIGDGGYDGPTGRSAARYALENLASMHAGLEEMSMATFDDGYGGTDYVVPAIAAAEGYIDEGMFDACVANMVADPGNAGTGSGSPLAYVWAGVRGNSDAAVRFSQLVGDARRDLQASGNVELVGLCEDVTDSLRLAGEEDALEAWESRMLPGIGLAEGHDGPVGEVVTDSGIARIRAEEKLESMNPQMREALDQFTRAYLAGVAAITRGEPVMVMMQGGDVHAPAPDVGEEDREVARSVIDGIEF